jgi:hypothetical protein
MRLRISKEVSRGIRSVVTKNSRKPNRPRTASFQTPHIGTPRRNDASTPASAPAAIASPKTRKKKIVKPGGTALS